MAIPILDAGILVILLIFFYKDYQYFNPAKIANYDNSPQPGFNATTLDSILDEDAASFSLENSTTKV